MAETRFTSDVKRVFVEMRVSDGNASRVFVFPPAGPNFYRENGSALLSRKEGLSLPTGYETAILIPAAYDNSKDPEYKEVRGIMKDRWVNVFQRNLWTPESSRNFGMYSIHDPKAVGLSQPLTEEELEDRLSGAEVYQGVRISQDGTVAHAPRNTIRLGDQNSDSLRGNGLLIATYSPKGAENLADLCKTHLKNRSRVWGLSEGKIGEEAVQTLSALGSGNGGSLFVDGSFGDYRGGWGGYAFGVKA